MKFLGLSRNLLQFGIDLGAKDQYGVLRESNGREGTCVQAFSVSSNLWEDSKAPDALCWQLDQLDPGKKAAISLCSSGYPLRLKELLLPSMRQSDLKKVVVNEIEQYFNWTAEDCLYDYAVYPDREKQSSAVKQIQLVLYALPKEPIYALLQRLQAAGRRLQVLDLRANALWRCLSVPAEAAAEQAILDFCVDPIECSIFRDGILRRQHNLNRTDNPDSPDDSAARDASHFLQSAAAFLNFYRAETQDYRLNDLYLLLPQKREDRFAEYETELRQWLTDSSTMRIKSLTASFQLRFSKNPGMMDLTYLPNLMAAYGLTLNALEQGEA